MPMGPTLIVRPEGFKQLMIRRILFTIRHPPFVLRGDSGKGLLPRLKTLTPVLYHASHDFEVFFRRAHGSLLSGVGLGGTASPTLLRFSSRNDSDGKRKKPSVMMRFTGYDDTLDVAVLTDALWPAALSWSPMYTTGALRDHHLRAGRSAVDRVGHPQLVGAAQSMWLRFRE